MIKISINTQERATSQELKFVIYSTSVLQILRFEIDHNFKPKIGELRSLFAFSLRSTSIY